MNSPARFARFAFFAGIGVGALFLLNRFYVANYPLSILHVLLDPVVSTTLQLKARASAPWRAFASGVQLQRELDDLQHKFNEIAQENARLLELQHENDQLRSILKFKDGTTLQLVVARVVGRIHEDGATFFTLNKGERDGIGVGAPVIADQIFIGKVLRVNSTWSVASALTAPQVKTAATPAGYEKNAGILEGELNLGEVLRFIPKDVALHEGMPIISSGLEEKVPRGLLIGFVERIESQAQDLFQTAYLKSPVRFDEVFLVSIISPTVK